MLAYRLDKPLSQIKIIQDIEKLIAKSNVGQNSILTITISNIAYDDTTPIPKLEHYNLDN